MRKMKEVDMIDCMKQKKGGDERFLMPEKGDNDEDS